MTHKKELIFGVTWGIATIVTLFSRPFDLFFMFSLIIIGSAAFLTGAFVTLENKTPQSKLIIRRPPSRDTTILWRKSSLKMDLKDYVRPLLIAKWTTNRIVADVLSKTLGDFKGKYTIDELVKRIKTTIRVERIRR